MRKQLLFVSFLCCALASFGQWSNDPSVNTPLIVETGNQSNPLNVSDGSGGVISVWTDDRLSSYDPVTMIYTSKSKIYAQKLSTAGVKQWGVSGVKVSDSGNNLRNPILTADGAGGVIIVWEEDLTGNEDNNILYAQRLNVNGVKQWGANGIVICNSVGSKYIDKQTVISDGSGGFVVAWEDYRLDPVDGDNSQIYTQRVNSAGAIQWTANGVLVSDNVGANYGGLILPDAPNGYIVLWVEEIEDVNGVLYEGQKAYSQKLNTDGTRKSVNNTLQFNFPPATIYTGIEGVASDGAGGIYLSFVEDDEVTAKLYLQHILNDNTRVFPNAIGTLVDASIGEYISNNGNGYVNYTSNLEQDNSGGAILSWTDKRDISGTLRKGIYAQRFNATGTKVWDATDVRIIPDLASSAALEVRTNQAGDYVFLISKTSGSFDNLYVQKVSPLGVIQYSSNGVLVAGNLSYKRDVEIIATGDKVVVVWEDNRNGDSDIYAQSVFPSGVLPVQFTEFVANYFNQQTQLKWSTASEANNDYFEIEHSEDGKTFQSIGTKKGSGTTSQLNNYTFTDLNAVSKSGYLYYRVKQVDTDGKFDYSEIKVVKVPVLSSLADFSFYPNPLQDKLNINIKQKGTSLKCEVTDVSGKLWISQTVDIKAESLELSFENIPSGIYVIKVQDGDKSYSGKVIKK